jgi:nifR3 family TIM-barrel protein
MQKSPLGFWKKLKKPIMALAPMADVTDVAFRELFAKYGKPDVMMTEFVNVDNLCSVGRKNLLKELKYTEKQRPIVAQLWGNKPENFFESAKLMKKMKFDGIDINMGCPEKNVCKVGSGAALIETPQLAQEVIQATIEGAGGLPVSVKTRAGYNKVVIDTWIPTLLDAGPAAITLHCRTKKQLSKVAADWDLVKQAVEMAKGSGVLILGNGDVNSLSEAHSRVKETGCDGVMVGRGVFGDPWFFNKKISRDDISREELFAVLLEHTKLFEKMLGDKKNFAIMKKHYKAYVNGFKGAKELRARLMEAESVGDVKTILK